MTKRTYTQQEVDLVKMSGKIDSIEETLKNMEKKFDIYITKDEHRVYAVQQELLQRIVYGLVGLILTAVIGGMVAFYINR